MSTLNTQALVHTNTFTHRRFAQTTQKSQFDLCFGPSNLISCERVAIDNSEIAILPQFLTIEPDFVRKGCNRHLGNRNFP